MKARVLISLLKLLYPSYLINQLANIKKALLLITLKDYY